MSYYENKYLEISKLTTLKESRDKVNSLSDNEKLKMLLELTDSKDFAELLGFIQSAYDDADFCQSYR